MQHHVHTANPQHRVIEIITVKHPVVKVRPFRCVKQNFRVPPPQIFARFHQKAASTAGWVANDIGGNGFGHFYHQLNDMARCAKLAVLACAGDFAKHVLV